MFEMIATGMLYPYPGVCIRGYDYILGTLFRMRATYRVGIYSNRQFGRAISGPKDA